MASGLLGMPGSAPAAGTVKRYAYVNTASTAGRGQRVTFRPSDVDQLRKWVNSNGNPTYAIRLHDGTVLLCVDDHGGENGLRSRPITFVRRKLDLTWGWL